MPKTKSTEILPLLTQSCCDTGLQPHLADAASQAAAELLKSLADPARLQILAILSQHAGEVCVCDFEGVVGMPNPKSGQRPKQPTISHHLKVLREAGWIGAQKRGLWAYYFINPARLATVRTLLALLAEPDAAPARAR